MIFLGEVPNKARKIRLKREKAQALEAKQEVFKDLIDISYFFSSHCGSPYPKNMKEKEKITPAA